MNLIDIYIHEVTRRLPEKNREDIALELRSTIEDMLLDNYSEEDVKAVLEKLGNPVTLASGYRDQPMHLIGPRYFDVYITLLKMILPIATVISLISVIAEYVIGYGGEETVINSVLTIIGGGIRGIIEVGIQTFFWLTLVFAILERTDKGKDGQPYTTKLTKWTPDDLKKISVIPKKKAISKLEVFGSLMWTAIWATFYFYANHLVGVYEGGDRFKFVTPSFNQEVLLEYWPIVLVVIGFEIALALYKLIKGQWTKRMALCNAALQLIATITFIVIVRNPNILNQDFITYMTNLFTITSNQFETWLVSGGISIFILSAVITVNDGFRKARIR
ncbi:HAAS signaling domain-containing protein [Neobacillus massiliamazoniensis]|uniref:Membrane protein n=1 Tax=Neobacillus massiliamazoniensis TaxID=1499688 RepID=A0A0U1NXN6_9BACI|nr:hypothetical protein [Neobacillus massiliamazoniensis]CRK82790.1 membrane protein [Neobacillus massiliamazoniensis]